MRCGESNDVGVGDLGLAEVEIFLDGERELEGVRSNEVNNGIVFMCLQVVETHTSSMVSRGNVHRLELTYQLKKASMNPNQAKLNTRPYLLNGLSMGIDRALPLIGLMAGACHSVLMSKPIVSYRE